MGAQQQRRDERMRGVYACTAGAVVLALMGVTQGARVCEGGRQREDGAVLRDTHHKQYSVDEDVGFESYIFVRRVCWQTRMFD